MALTKPDQELDPCQEIAQNTVVEGVNKDISADYDLLLYIQAALTSETAHTGTQFIVQICSTAAVEEDWVLHDEWVGLIGTANSEVITNNPLALGAPVITVADTTGYVTNAADLFLEDVTVFANSEWLTQKSYIANTSVTAVDGVTRQHALNSILYNVAQTYAILIPWTAKRVRVLYNNCYDADGSTIAVRSRLVEVTAVS